MRYTTSRIQGASVSRGVALFFLCAGLTLPLASFGADGAFLFNSRFDDWTNGGCAYPLQPPFNASSTDCLLQGLTGPEPLYLYVDPGANPVFDDCSGLCGIHTVVESEGAFFTSFDAEEGVSHWPKCEAPAGNVGCPLPPMTDRVTIVTSFASADAPPNPPVRRVGTLFIDVTPPTGNSEDGATVSVNGVEIIDGAGAESALPREFIAIPEPGVTLQWLCGVLGLTALHARRRRLREPRH